MQVGFATIISCLDHCLEQGAKFEGVTLGNEFKSSRAATHNFCAASKACNCRYRFQGEYLWPWGSAADPRHKFFGHQGCLWSSQTPDGQRRQNCQCVFHGWEGANYQISSACWKVQGEYSSPVTIHIPLHKHLCKDGKKRNMAVCYGSCFREGW